MELLRVPEEALFRGPALTGVARTGKRLLAVTRDGLVLWKRYGSDAVTGVVQLRNVHRAQVVRLANGTTMVLFVDSEGGVVGPATGVSVADEHAEALVVALGKLRPLYRFKVRPRAEDTALWLECTLALLDMEPWVELARQYRAEHGGPMQAAKAADTAANLLEAWADVRAPGLDKKDDKKQVKWRRLYVVLTGRFVAFFERPSQLAERGRYFVSALASVAEFDDLFSWRSSAKQQQMAGLTLAFAAEEVVLLFKTAALATLWQESLVGVRDGRITERSQIAVVPGAVQPRSMRALKTQSGSSFSLLKTLNSSFESLRNLSPGPGGRRRRSPSVGDAAASAAGDDAGTDAAQAAPASASASAVAPGRRRGLSLRASRLGKAAKSAKEAATEAEQHERTAEADGTADDGNSGGGDKATEADGGGGGAWRDGATRKRADSEPRLNVGAARTSASRARSPLAASAESARASSRSPRPRSPRSPLATNSESAHSKTKSPRHSKSKSPREAKAKSPREQSSPRELKSSKSKSPREAKSSKSPREAKSKSPREQSSPRELKSSKSPRSKLPRERTSPQDDQAKPPKEEAHEDTQPSNDC